MSERNRSQRDMFGWFGVPWPSIICYEDDGTLREDMHKSFPTGDRCIFCTEELSEKAGDSGKAIPHVGDNSLVVIQHAHKECIVMQVFGSLSHHEKQCACYGGNGIPGMTLRQEALKVWNDVLNGSE